MKRKTTFNYRKLFPIICVLLAIAAFCSVYLLINPSETPVEKTMTGTLLYEDGTTESVELQLAGTLSVYYFGNENTSFRGTLTVNGSPVAEDFTVVFDGTYGTSNAQIVCKTDYQLAAAVTVEGKSCLLVSSAEPDALLAELLPYADAAWQWPAS